MASRQVGLVADASGHGDSDDGAGSTTSARRCLSQGSRRGFPRAAHVSRLSFRIRSRSGSWADEFLSTAARLQGCALTFLLPPPPPCCRCCTDAAVGQHAASIKAE